MMKMHKSCALVALGLLALLAGCESDSVTPHDPLPELTTSDAASQASAVTKTIGEIAVGVLDPNLLKEAEPYPVDDAGFEGMVWMDFRTAEGGSEVPWNVAGWVHVYTEEDAPVVYTTPFGGMTEFHLDYEADIDRNTNTGTINGGGSMGSGDYALTYSITNLTVVDDGNPATDDYPHVGRIEVATQGHTVEVDFDTGNANTAMMVVDSTEGYLVNLATGDFDPVPI